MTPSEDATIVESAPQVSDVDTTSQLLDQEEPQKKTTRTRRSTRKRSSKTTDASDTNDSSKSAAAATSSADLADAAESETLFTTNTTDVPAEPEAKPTTRRTRKSKKSPTAKPDSEADAIVSEEPAITDSTDSTDSASNLDQSPADTPESSAVQESPVTSDDSAVQETSDADTAQGNEGSAEPTQDSTDSAQSESESREPQRKTATARRESSRDQSSREQQGTREQQRKSDSRQSSQRRQQTSRQSSSRQSSDSHSGKDSSRTQGSGRKPRRHHQSSHEPVEPQVNREDLAALKVVELRSKASELGISIKHGTRKDELVDLVFNAQVRAEGFVDCEGVLDLFSEGYGFLRAKGYLPSESDVYVGVSTIRRNGLRKGDWICGQVRPPRDTEKYSALHRIDTINGLTLEESKKRCKFADLTPVYPDERLVLEHGADSITARTIDLVAPIGKGQRGLIVSPPKAGKTTILKDIAASISVNNPDVHLMCLLVDERPEEVTDMERSIKGEVISSTFDMPSENHIAVAELVIERAKRLVEAGNDVVILLDSITRLARAYNLAQPASGRVLSGGVDSTALYPPKRFLGAARNIENGGSLTILASALIDTGSKMDEVIFEEFKGTGNMELKLDRSLADRRIFPAIDPISSGTRKEELLIDGQLAPLIWGLRRVLANLNNTERAMEMLIKSLKQTKNNTEFLMRTAKKAAQGKNSNSIDL